MLEEQKSVLENQKTTQEDQKTTLEVLDEQLLNVERDLRQSLNKWQTVKDMRWWLLENFKLFAKLKPALGGMCFTSQIKLENWYRASKFQPSMELVHGSCYHKQFEAVAVHNQWTGMEN